MKRLIKLMAIALCMLLVLSTALASVFALSMEGVSLKPAASDGQKSERADTKASLFKDESVYVIAESDGSVKKIIVSDWIQNNAKAETVTDFSMLDGIENIKSDETFTLNSDNMRVWEAKGKDLYLKGESDEPLPVDMSLTYFLDGAPVDPADLVGKSGDVTIRFDYTNNQYETVKINGKKEKIYVPFIMMSGLILDNKKFSDVSVTNGKIFNDGDRTIIAGIAFPGLQQALGLKQKDISIPDYFEIKAHAEDFELNSTVTIATNSPVNQLDTKKLNKIDDVKKDLNKLDSAMTKLIDGSSELYDGLGTLLEKSSTLTSGIDALYNGAKQLSEGADKVDAGAGQLKTGALKLKVGAGQVSDGAGQVSSGAKDLSSGTVQVDNGAGQLSGGLKTLSNNNDSLTKGSEQTFQALLNAARKSLQEQGLDVPELTPENYAEVLQGLIDGLSEEKVRAKAKEAAHEKVKAAVEANRDTITAAVTEAVRENVKAQVEPSVKAQVTQSVLSAMGYTVEEYNAGVSDGSITAAVQSQVNSAVEAQMASDQTKATINSLVEQNMQSDAVQATIKQNTDEQIDSLIDQNMQSDEVQQGINDAVAKAKEGVKSIQSLKEQLDSFGKFNTGLKTYTSGVKSASEGADTLKSGTAQLKTGSGKLSTGAGQLNTGAIQLKDGTIVLYDGTKELKTGTSKLSGGAKELLDGILTMKNGVPALVTGVSKLKNGSMQLSEGLRQFNEQGVSKIVDLVNGDLGNTVSRLKAVASVSKHYKSYTGLTDEMDGEVKFIYKTADISKEDK